MDSTRIKNDFREQYEYYFNFIKQKIKEYYILIKNIYNMDEKGFLISCLSKSKQIFTKETF